MMSKEQKKTGKLSDELGRWGAVSLTMACDKRELKRIIKKKGKTITQKESLTINDFRVFLVISACQGKGDYTWCGINEISNLSGVPVSTVKRCLPRLQRFGWINRTRRGKTETSLTSRSWPEAIPKPQSEVQIGDTPEVQIGDTLKEHLKEQDNVDEKEPSTPTKKRKKEDKELHNQIKALIQQYHEKVHNTGYYHDKREAGAVAQIASRVKANGGLEMLEKKLTLMTYRIREAKTDYDRGLTCTPRRVLGEWNSLQPKVRQHG